jgi:hypothetical protein
MGCSSGVACTHPSIPGLLPASQRIKGTQPSPEHRVSVSYFLKRSGMMRSIYELTTEEAYRLVAEHFGHDLPPLEAVENEDWGRDYVLQHFLRHSEEELAAAGLTWEPAEEDT